MLSEENQCTSQVRQTVPLSDVDVCILTAAHELAHSESSDFGFAIGREFPDINALRNALSDMAIITGRKYEHARTTPTKFMMKCRDSSCGWHIHATSLSKLSPTFKVVKYQEVHTCTVGTNSGDEDHPQATVRWILSKVQASLEKDPNMEPSKIVTEMKDRYRIKISYNKAVEAKTKALEVIRRQCTPHIYSALKEELERDSATICKLGVNSDGGGFQYLFWSFQACIDALRNHLRPVVYVGRVHTRIGVLMYAGGIDGDGSCGNPIEVGFAFYDCREDEKLSWERFLGWLEEFVLPPTTVAAGIPFSIVTDFRKTSLTGAVENVLPHLHHFFYPSSVAGYFSSNFEGDNLYTPCFQACLSFSTEKCESYLQEIKCINIEAYEWLLSSVGSKSHWAVAFSPNKHAHAISLGLNNFDYVLGENLSIVEIVEISKHIVADYFLRRRSKGEEAARTTSGLTPNIMGYIKCSALDMAKEYEVEPIDGHKYQVSKVSYRPFEEVVDLEEKSCTCGEFQATGYPCHHAFWVIIHLSLDVRKYISQWHSLDTYRATYAGSLPPLIPDNISHWDTPIAGLPLRRRKVGRPRKCKRICQETV